MHDMHIIMEGSEYFVWSTNIRQNAKHAINCSEHTD